MLLYQYQQFDSNLSRVPELSTTIHMYTFRYKRGICARDLYNDALEQRPGLV